MLRKTLGGDRLGSGNKMDVELKNYERSTHNRGYLWRSTMASGTVVPFMVQIGLPGDTLDIDLNCVIKTHPTIGPLFGSFKVQLDVFEAPIRLYIGELHNNKTGIGMQMQNVLFPRMRLTAQKFTLSEITDVDNSQINPSCLLSYLGIRGIGYVTPESEVDTKQRYFNATSYLMYWELIKNYYSNKQEEIAAVIFPDLQAIAMFVDSAVIATPAGSVGDAYPIEGGGGGVYIDLVEGTQIRFLYTAPNVPIPSQLIIILQTGQQIPFDEICTDLVNTGARWEGAYNFAKYGNQFTAHWRYITDDELQNGPPKVHTFPLSNIDTMREKLLQWTGAPTAFTVNDQFLPGATPIEPYCLLLEPQNNSYQYLGNQSGLALKTYQSDLFNNWLKTSWIDGPTGVSAVTAIDTSSGSFTLDALTLSKKMWELLNRIAVSGGTFTNWLETVWAHKPPSIVESPIYHGGLSKELIFQEVVSNSESQGNEGTQPLGTLAGKGTMASKHKGGKLVIRVNEPSYIMGLISITPRLDYSQGNSWDVNLTTIDDLHKPQLDGIGFQELLTERLAWWATKFNPADETVITTSAGKQPSWIEYMTETNKTFGNFAIATNEMFMTLNRRYEAEEDPDSTGLRIADLTTYIDPMKYNNIFAQTSRDAQNFWVQIAVDNIHRRKMSAKLIPNL